MDDLIRQLSECDNNYESVEHVLATEFGIKCRDNNGMFRPIVEIMDDIAAKWKEYEQC